jgi:hypothetical protein
MTQGGHEMMVNGGVCWGDQDGEGFEHGYLRQLSVIGQCENSP